MLNYRACICAIDKGHGYYWYYFCLFGSNQTHGKKIRHAWFMIYNFGQVAKNTPTWRVFPTWVLVPKCVFFSLIVVLSSYIFQAVVHLFKVAESSAKSKNIPNELWFGEMVMGFLVCVLDFATIVIYDGIVSCKRQLWK